MRMVIKGALLLAGVCAFCAIVLAAGALWRLDVELAVAAAALWAAAVVNTAVAVVSAALAVVTRTAPEGRRVPR